jgi:hypothetical protein
MITFEKYHKEVVENAIKHWEKEDHNVFNKMEKDPVVNLLLSALSYQSYDIRKNIEEFRENTIRDLHDRIVPFNLLQPVPAFSIIQTKIKKNHGDLKWRKTIDETCSFEFIKNRDRNKNFTFSPLLKTEIIDAECVIADKNGNENSIFVELQAEQDIKNISGVSFYFESEFPVTIDEIWYAEKKLPLIKPSQYNELPFTQWFNNHHWGLNKNFFLFGSYDYWQEIFLTNTANLYYIGNYNSKKIVFENKKNIELEIVFNSHVDKRNIKTVKINCIPVVNIEKNEITLNRNNPIQELSSENGEFLQLLYNQDMCNMEKYINSFLVRRYGVERYNPQKLLEQLQEISYRYISDYYAFQTIPDLKNSSKIEELQKAVKDILSSIPNDHKAMKNSYYALLQTQGDDKDVYLEYLSTSGELANGIKKDEKVTKINTVRSLNHDTMENEEIDLTVLDRNQTILIQEVKGGKNSISDETQKEDTAKYCLLTKDRLVTMADIRSFCYKELGYQNIENIDIRKNSNEINIDISLKKNSLYFENEEKLEQKLEQMKNILPKKMSLRSNDMMKFIINFI